MTSSNITVIDYPTEGFALFHDDHGTFMMTRDDPTIHEIRKVSLSENVARTKSPLLLSKTGLVLNLSPQA